ncbi:angiopoietin-related protein 1 [Leptinotarsa decemlineata]|uniref:angiopoietin-related protein 1 n=1 Tax=Leptinotarsa decemlineata TaxID=7539 RepID=UPI003D30631F
MARVMFLNFIALSVVIIVESKVLVRSDRNIDEKQPPYENPIFVSRHRNGAGQLCDAKQIEYELTRLEVKLDEKSDRLISELREANRRLQALEYQDSEIETALRAFRGELGRFWDSSPPLRSQHEGGQRQVDEKLESRVDTLVKGVQLVVAALRTLNSDIGLVKNNVSSIAVETSIIRHHQQDLVTKQFLTNSLLDINHDQHYPPIPNGLFTKSEYPKSRVPRSCRDIQNGGVTDSGIYQIQPEHAHKPFLVLCDMETRDGGWTYIHNRYDGSQDFFLNWHEYKTGFGNIGGEFWLGLENIYQITGHEINELLIELVDGNNTKAFAHYAVFSVGSEVEGYALKVLGGFSGDASDSLKYHAGSRFSTKDLDQDGWIEGNCAQAHTGAWWYRGCDTSNLNGKYLNGVLPESNLYQGMYWAGFGGPQYSLAQARMMVRPRDENSPPLFPNGIAEHRKG